ncbi:hypothetical protein TrVFT333_007725 [Trichoderma virens FT-333]|nr:hypothetical protein TrVFT333_007725 [Trichoderma virens FT-333]
MLLREWAILSNVEQIVPRTSATFNGTNTENHSLDYDHSGLNKYNNVSDEGYVKVVSILNNMTRSITEEEYKSGLRKAGAEESWSQISRGLKSHRCNTKQCRNELYSAWSHILTDRVLQHERQWASTEEWIAEMEDGWWKTTYSWVFYFHYVLTYPPTEEERIRRSLDRDRSRCDYDPWYY